MKDGHLQGHIQITSTLFSLLIWSISSCSSPCLGQMLPGALAQWHCGCSASSHQRIPGIRQSPWPPGEKRRGSGCSPRFSFLLLRSCPCMDSTHVQQSNTNCDNHQAGLLQSDLPPLGSTAGNIELQLLCQLCCKYLIAETPSIGCCCTGGNVVFKDQPIWKTRELGTVDKTLQLFQSLR